MTETLCTDSASPPGRPGPAGRPGPTRRGWTLALASAGAFMAALDVVVVSTALPTLHGQLGASLSQLEWTINAYSLVFGCLMLTGAALGDRFGSATARSWWPACFCRPPGWPGWPPAPTLGWATRTWSHH